MNLKTVVPIMLIVVLLTSNLSMAQKFGKYTATLTEVDPSTFGGKITEAGFNDESITISWLLSDTEVFFDLTNNSPSTIKINWEEAAYIDTKGETNKIFHNGVKYNERNGSQPASSVIKGAKIKDLIAPSDYAYFLSGSYGGWKQRALFPYSKKIGPIYDGQTFKILLPLTIGESRRDYIFSFVTKWVPAEKK